MYSYDGRPDTRIMFHKFYFIWSSPVFTYFFQFMCYASSLNLEILRGECVGLNCRGRRKNTHRRQAEFCSARNIASAWRLLKRGLLTGSRDFFWLRNWNLEFDARSCEPFAKTQWKKNKFSALGWGGVAVRGQRSYTLNSVSLPPRGLIL